MKIKDLLTPDETNNINKMIKSFGKNDEFEVGMFSSKETSSHLLSLERFNHLNSVLSIITKKSEEKLTPITEQSLDIIFSIRPKTQPTESIVNYRIQITSMDKINEYMSMLHMRKNHLVVSVLAGFIEESGTKNNFMKIEKKTKNVSNYVTVEDIYMRFKLDKEEELTIDELKKLQNIKKNWDMNDYDIFFRFKERTSYFIPKGKNVFRIDLTTTRTSNQINLVEKSHLNYEIEIETDIKDKSTVFDQIFDVAEFIIKIVQQSNYIITKSMSNEVLARYKAILGVDVNRTHLYGRQPESLEIHHVVDYLPNKYTVTDKADGDRNMLIVHETKCYLISSNLIVKDIGLSVDKKYNGSILDGEFIFLPKFNKYLYMCFDCLTLGEKNIREENMMIERLKMADILINSINKTEYEHKYLSSSKLDFSNLDKVLEWHKKNITNFYDDIDKELQSKNVNVIVRRKYFVEVNGISDNEVFKYSALMWNLCTIDSNVKCPYLLDGLIYQPSDQKYIVEREKIKYVDFKWKPPQKNSIDFYVEFEKDKSSKKILTVYDNSVPSVVKNKPYQILNLYVGLNIKGVEKPVLFNVNENASQCYLYLDVNNVPRSADGRQINDKTVVEFYFNTTSEAPTPYKWMPIKTRYDKTESVQKFEKRYGNYQDTATKVWHSILNPVLMSDFVQLSNDLMYNKYHKELKSRIDFSLIKMDKQQIVYYQKKTKLTEDMRAFHNWIKTNLIYTYLNPLYDDNIRYNVLDVGVGQGGDIMKYYYVEIALLVGIDPDLSGLVTGTNCAVARYQNLKSTHPDFPPMFFVQANPANLLQFEEQEKIIGKMNFDNKKLFDRFFTWDKNKTVFDRVNSSLSIHYLLSDSNSWDNFCNNLNMYMRDGALFTITTLDGEKIFDKLKDKDNYAEYYEENGEKKVLFDIVKKYDEQSQDKIGQAIDVHMAWAFDDGVYQTEYLVYPEFLIKSLKEKCNMELIETGLFEDLFNENKAFLELSSEIEESVGKKFFSNVYKYYTPNELNIRCYEYTFLHRYYVFRRAESNLNELRERKAQAKKTNKERKQRQKNKKF